MLWSCEASRAPVLHSVAGCTRTELRTTPDGGVPWYVLIREYDLQERIIREELELLGGSLNRDVILHVYEDDLLIEESITAYRDASVGVVVQRHTYDSAQLRIQTDEFRGPDPAMPPLLGRWQFTYDEEGLPTGGTWDEGADGSIEGTRIERWERQVFGWTIDITELRDDEPPRRLSQERDDEQRLLWMVEDWDDDGVTDRIEQLEYVGPLIARRDIAGPHIVDEGCRFHIEQGRILGSTCWNQLREGAFVERFFHWGDPDRPQRGIVARVRNGEREPWDLIEFEWDCPT